MRIAASVSAASPGNNTAARTPILVLLGVAVLLIILVLLAPHEDADGGAIFNSYSANNQGTRGLYDVLSRLGFATSRNVKPLTAPPDSNSAFFLLQPAQPLTAVEQNNLLGAVRRGAVLVFTADDGEFADSLGFGVVAPSDGFYTMLGVSVAGGNPPSPVVRNPNATLQNAFPVSTVLKSKTKSGNQTFMWLDSQTDSAGTPVDSAQRLALVLGHRFGQGYAIGISSAPIVTNRLLRNPAVAVAIFRALRYANTATAVQPRSNLVVFDEYHHGFGVHADVAAAVERALSGTPVGRMTLEIMVAALILVLAFAVRPIAPLPAPSLSRRSPLEHVGALAHAYLKVNARQLATGRLIRGLRRRHPLGFPRSMPDSAYLSSLRERFPGVSMDVDRLLASLTAISHDSSDHFATTGAAVANIERAFKA